MEDTINYEGVELPLNDARDALDEAEDENGNISGAGHSGDVSIIGDGANDNYAAVANTRTNENTVGYLNNLREAVGKDVYNEQFEALKAATDGSFDIDVREAEVVDTRGKRGDHNALVAVEADQPWNMQMNSGGWPYDDFSLRYFRTVNGRTELLNDYGVEMDDVGAIFYFMLDEDES